jgi:hypothetical protein
MDPKLIAVLGGISSLLGLLAVIANIYFSLQSRHAPRSVRRILEGEGLFNADQILQVLSKFNDDQSRLAALREFTHTPGTTSRKVPICRT